MLSVQLNTAVGINAHVHVWSHETQMQVPPRSVGIVLIQMTLELNPFDVSLAMLPIQLVDLNRRWPF